MGPRPPPGQPGGRGQGRGGGRGPSPGRAGRGAPQVSPAPTAILLTKLSQGILLMGRRNMLPAESPW